MPPPPPAEGLASRLFLGPALRTQPDRRLVALVRQGYESAFEEIVRRYGKPLGRYAAAVVPGHRAEDVTQDAFSKALLALRRTDAEIELRPWLFRIVRNTALNDIRDQPPPSEELDERGDAAGSALEEALRREDVADLMRRLRALPDPQRAAIVMRELEGLSHEEIAAALGITGNAARQAIYRARTALRDGVGLLLPLPVLKMLLGGSVAGEATAAATGLSGAAAGTAGGVGAGAALKAAAATVLVAGTVGGMALHDQGKSGSERGANARVSRAAAGATRSQTSASALAEDVRLGENSGPERGGGGAPEGSGEGGHSGPGGGDSGSGDRSGDGDPGGSSSSGPGPSIGSDDGSGGSGSDSSGSDSSGSGSSDGGGSISGSSGPGPSGSEDSLLELSGTDRSGSDSGSGISGSGEGSSGSGPSGSDTLSGSSGSD